MNHSMPGLPVHHQLPEFTQTHIHRVSDAIQPSHPLSSPSPPAPIPPSITVFSNESTLCMRWPKYWSFSFSIIPSKKSQGWSPSEWTGWISLQSKGLSRVFSNTTVQKHQFLGAQPSSWPNSHIWTWLLDYMVIPLLKLLCWPPSEFLHWPTRPCGSGSSCLSGLICSVPPSPVLLQSHQALLLSFLGTDMFLPQGLSTCCFMVWNALPLVIHVDSFLTSLRSLLKYLSESPFFTTLFKITMSF